MESNENNEVKKAEIYKEILQSDNVKELLNLVKEKFKTESQIEIESSKTTFKSFFIERGIYFFIVIASFLAIIYCATNQILDGTVTGTLIGTIIGYTLAKASKTKSDE